jgi:hypothetical protein
MQPIDINAPEDIALLREAEGLSVGGMLVLPSGLHVPNPPPGKRWIVHTQPKIQIHLEEDHELEQI